MIAKTEIIAKKYALALLNLYSKQIGNICFESLRELNNFFKKNKKILMYLNIPSLPDDVKKQVLEGILQKLNTCNTISIVAHTLLKQRRINLLDNVVDQIVRQYKIRKNILNFKVLSSHSLDQAEKKIVLDFLQKSVNATIQADFFIDKKLICGIKILGDNIMWERSFVKRLENVKRSILHRVQL